MVKKHHFSCNAITDIEIIEHAMEGDEKAFATLLEKYHAPIYYLILKKVGNEIDAEDLAMETFAKAFNNLGQYAPIFAFSTWLFKIAINNCIDFVRRKKTRPSSYYSNVDLNDPNSLEFMSGTLTPEDIIIKKQKAELLKEVIKNLKPQYAKLIELRYYKEFTYDEIAEELSVPKGSIKGQLFRAKESLAPLLQKKINSKNENI